MADIKPPIVSAPHEPKVVATTTFNSRPHRLVFVPSGDKAIGTFIVERQDYDAMGTEAWSEADLEEPSRFEVGSEAVATLMFALAFGQEVLP